MQRVNVGKEHGIVLRFTWLFSSESSVFLFLYFTYLKIVYFETPRHQHSMYQGSSLCSTEEHCHSLWSIIALICNQMFSQGQMLISTLPFLR